MNVLLQRHAAKYIYAVPEGLKELMSDISREVLRMQPQNLYVFIADYLEALLLTRENARVAARLVQSITEIAEATMEFLNNTGMDRNQIDKVVSIIHETFKKRIRDDAIAFPYERQSDVEEANIITDILHEADIGADLAEDAAKIIQNAYKKFKHRKEAEKQLLTGMIDWRVAARSAIKLYRQTGVTNEEANRAATLIKAAYKGYYTRRVMKKLTDEQKILQPEFEIEEISEAEEEDAEKRMGRVDSKTVKIDYDTVIPHVDFGDVTDLESPAAVISFALDKVVDNVMKKMGHPEECKFQTKDSKQKSQAIKKTSQQTKKSKKPTQKATAKTVAKTSIYSVGKASIHSAGKYSVHSAGQASSHSGRPASVHSGGQASVAKSDRLETSSKHITPKQSFPKKVSIHQYDEHSDTQSVAKTSAYSMEKGSIHSAGGDQGSQSEYSSHASEQSDRISDGHESEHVSESAEGSYVSEQTTKTAESKATSEAGDEIEETKD